MRWPGPMLNTIFIFITLVSFFWEETTRHPKCAAGATATHTVVLLLERHILRKKSNVSPSRKQSLKNTRIAAAPQRWFLANIYTHVAGRWTREQGIVTQKTAPYRPTAGAQKLGLSRVAQIVAFLQDWCDCKKYLPEVVMLRTTPKKAGGVSYDPKGRRRTTRPPGAACRSSLLRIYLYFGGAIVGTGQGTTRRA